MVTFRAILELAGKTATGITVPESAVIALGKGKRPPVRVTINGYTYRSTVAPYSGDYMLPVSAEHREAAGVKAGEEIEVQLELDDAPRTVDVPDDLAQAMADASVRQAFDRLSFTNRKEIVVSVEGAKTEATRQRRIEKAVESLRASA